MNAHVTDILQAPKERLGLFRLALGLYLVLYLVIRAPVAYETIVDKNAVFEPVGMVKWLATSAPLPEGLALFIYGLAIIFAALFFLGAHFRITGPVTALLLLWVTSYKSSFSMLFHSENLVTLQVLLVGFSPAGRSLSWDQRRGRVNKDASLAPGYPLLFASLVTIVAYLVAGVAKLKLGGADWLNGDILRIQVAYDNVRKIELGSAYAPLGVWAVKQAWFFPGLAILTMLAELGGPLALLHRRLALLWAALLIGFHWGVLVLMAITFSYPLSGVPFFCFFALEKTRLGKKTIAFFAASHAEHGTTASTESN